MKAGDYVLIKGGDWAGECGVYEAAMGRCSFSNRERVCIAIPRAGKILVMYAENVVLATGDHATLRETWGYGAPGFSLHWEIRRRAKWSD